jgi:hypothetical protein
MTKLTVLVLCFHCFMDNSIVETPPFKKPSKCKSEQLLVDFTPLWATRV